MVADQLYIIDEKYKIISTDENWDAFAELNDSTTQATDVVGRSIWDFISHEKVRSLYKKLFDAARANQKKLTIAFRCDSDKCIRHMQMDIIPVSNSVIKVTTSLINEVPRKKMLSSPIIYIGVKQALKMCSSCNKIYIKKQSAWLEIDQALQQKLIPEPLNVRYDLCGECEYYLKSKIN